MTWTYRSNAKKNDLVIACCSGLAVVRSWFRACMSRRHTVTCGGRKMVQENHEKAPVPI